MMLNLQDTTPSGWSSELTVTPAVSPAMARAAAIKFEQAKTPLLEILPEIRNEIYNLVFSTDTTQPVSLDSASPPSKALLLACRQTYAEARLVHRVARCRFWTKTKLTVETGPIDNMTTLHAAMTAVKRMTSQDLSHITHLEVTNDDWNELTTFEGGFWTYHSKIPPGPYHAHSRSVYVPFDKVIVVREAGFFEEYYNKAAWSLDVEGLSIEVVAEVKALTGAGRLRKAEVLFFLWESRPRA